MIETANIKAFKLNDCDWIAAQTLEEAIGWYLKETGLDRGEAIDDPREVLLTLPVYSDEVRSGSPDTTLAGLISQHVLQGFTFPCVIAQLREAVFTCEGHGFDSAEVQAVPLAIAGEIVSALQADIDRIVTGVADYRRGNPDAYPGKDVIDVAVQVLDSGGFYGRLAAKAVREKCELEAKLKEAQEILPLLRKTEEETPST